jgi:hypothetical protein
MSSSSNTTIDLRPIPAFDSNGRIIINRSAISQVKYFAFVLFFGFLSFLCFQDLFLNISRQNYGAILDFLGGIPFGFLVIWSLMTIIFPYRLELEMDHFTLVKFGKTRSFQYREVRKVFAKDVTRGSVGLQLVIEGCITLYDDFTLSSYDLGNLLIQLRNRSIPALATGVFLSPPAKTLITVPRIIVVGAILIALTAICGPLYRAYFGS